MNIFIRGHYTLSNDYIIFTMDDNIFSWKYYTAKIEKTSIFLVKKKKHSF